MKKRIELITDTLANDKKIFVNPRATDPLIENIKNKNAQTITADICERHIAYASDEAIANLGAIARTFLRPLS
jgi:hypothetical protein